MLSQSPTAAIIIIGNEILSGRVRDQNAFYIACKLQKIGIKLLEIRVVPDIKKSIGEAVLWCKDRYDYVFTSGGIGSTHDDITTESIASALGLETFTCSRTLELLKQYNQGKEISNANAKLALLPVGAEPLKNTIGFSIQNIYVMAGSPDSMKIMFDQVAPILKKGSKIFSKSIDLHIAEDLIADDFASLQKRYPQVEMGSYPFKKTSQRWTSLVLSSIDSASLNEAYRELTLLSESVWPKYKAK
jgi:molybdenum cofactor synthesis domain-containing protein